MKDEAYLAIANLEPQNKHELPLIKDQKVNVIKKELSGWWLAQDPETDELGWIPADFVERKYFCTFLKKFYS